MDNITKILSVGGLVEGEQSKQTNVYDIASGVWSSGGPLQQARAFINQSAVRVGKYIYVYAGSENNKSFDRFDTTTLKWDTNIGGVNVGRGGAFVGVAYDNVKYIYLVGGSGSSDSETLELFDEIYRYDTTSVNATAERVGKISKSIFGAYIFYYADKLYIVGGGSIDSNSSSHTDKLSEASAKRSHHIDLYDLKSNQSSSLLDLKLDQGDGVLASCFDSKSGNIYILSNYGKFYRVHIETKAITTLANSDQHSSSVSFVIGNDQIYSIESDATKIYSISKNSWSSASAKPIVSQFHTAIGF